MNGIPTELLHQIPEDLSAESLAALALVCKRLETQLSKKYEELGPPGSESRADFLRLFENESPQVYCPWCQKLHLPENAIPADDSSGRPCQSSIFAIGNTCVTFPSSYHPLILYRSQKPPHDKGGVADLQALLNIDTETITAPEYVCERVWEHSINPHGVFVAKRQSIVPDSGSEHIYIEDVCRHSAIKVRFAHLSNTKAASVMVMQCDASTHEGEPCFRDYGQVHGCLSCACDFLVEVNTSCVPPKIVMTTWYHLGQGKTPEDISIRQCNPVHRVDGDTNLGVGNIAKMSGLFEKL